MSIIEILGVSFAVAIDALAVSIAGTLCADSKRKVRNACNAALFFGGFQILMPVCGYYCSSWVVKYAGSFTNWIGFGLLAFVGTKMIIDGIKNGDDAEVCKLGMTDFFAPGNLILPAVATSIDALAVGAGFAFGKTELWAPAISMGVVTAMVSGAGVVLGSKLKRLAGERVMLMIGGAVLIAIGLKLLLST
ncbi:MAG: manganese efflux pump [Lentisphaeria bacterium]|nr:manganese efflux pump [Lentisphaeria bacterium]